MTQNYADVYRLLESSKLSIPSRTKFIAALSASYACLSFPRGAREVGPLLFVCVCRGGYHRPCQQSVLIRVRYFMLIRFLRSGPNLLIARARRATSAQVQNSAPAGIAILPAIQESNAWVNARFLKPSGRFPPDPVSVRRQDNFTSPRR